jgi:hypothetical protein
MSIIDFNHLILEGNNALITGDCHGSNSWVMWDFKFSRRRVWCSEFSTIILHGSISQKTILNTIAEFSQNWIHVILHTTCSISYAFLMFPLHATCHASFIPLYLIIRSWGSSVSIVSDYRLDDCGSISGRGKGFFSLLSVSRPAPGPTQPPSKWVSGVKHGRDVTLSTRLHLVPRSRISRNYTSSPP